MKRARWKPNPVWDTLRSQWSLRAGVTYLNHGSFGPSPRPVIAARREWQDRLESDPVDFLTRELDGLLREARQRVARWLGATGDDLVFVENATVGMNVVAASARLQPGDEVLANSHEYGAVLRTWERACRRSGAQLVVADVPCPLEDPQQIVDAVMSRATDRTRWLVVSHVTSPTALIFPVESLCRAARERGLMTCVDGPHALAMLPVNLEQLDCDYYTASCHKWLSAPFGSGLLYAHPRAQAALEPLVVSWGRTPANQAPSWRDEFTWAGTRDPSAVLAIPAAIGFLESVGIEAFQARGHWFAQSARESISAVTGLPPLSPDGPQWYGAMISLPLPPGDSTALQQALWEQFQIEVPIVDWQGQRLVRPSCHLYTQPDDLEKLASALATLL